MGRRSVRDASHAPRSGARARCGPSVDRSRWTPARIGTLPFGTRTRGWPATAGPPRSSWFGVAEPGVDVDQHELRDQQAECAPDLAREPLGHECPGTLTRAVELDHVQAVVIGLDETRQ